MKIMKVLVLMSAFAIASRLFAIDALDTLVQCNFTNTAASWAISDLARQAGVSVAFDPAVQDNLITLIKPEKVTFRKALEEVIALNQSGYIGRLGQNNDKFYIASADPKGPYYANIAGITMVTLQNIKTDELMVLLARYPLAGYISANQIGNTISIYAPPDITTNILKTITEVDQEKEQIEILAIVLDVSQQDTKNSGANFEFTNGPANKDGVKTIQFQNELLGYLDDTAGKILVSLANIIADDKLTIFAQPKIRVLEGEKGKIFIGQTIYSTSYVIGGPFTLVPGGIKAGINVEYIPRVINSVDENGKPVKDIKLTIDLGVSEVFGTGSQGLPVINERTISTTLKVRDGETIISAGLIRLFDYKIRSGIPILSDIPLIGMLFQKTRKEKRQQEIAILITPRVVVHSAPEELDHIQKIMNTGTLTPPK